MDDDPQLLDGLRRTLGFDFQVVTESDPLVALRRLEQDAGFEVVLSDLKMPQIDGTRFLARTQRINPAATRLLLTGVADLPSAIAAINEAGVFRFLSKPCSGDQLVGAVRAAVDQHRKLLEETAEALLARAPGGLARLRKPLRPPREQRQSGQNSGLFVARHPTPRSGAAAPPGSSQTRRSCPRTGSLLAVLAEVAEQALAQGHTRDAERMLLAPFETLLTNARTGKPTDDADCIAAAILAARLARATRDGTWLDYPFLLFTALKRLLPGPAIDEIQAALHQVPIANPGALQLYLSVLELDRRISRPEDRCLLRRIQQCRALLAAAI